MRCVAGPMRPTLHAEICQKRLQMSSDKPGKGAERCHRAVRDPFYDGFAAFAFPDLTAVPD